MPIRIDNPLEVGADRLVNAAAASTRPPAPRRVDFGTGIIRRRLRARRVLGGAIAPGLEIR